MNHTRTTRLAALLVLGSMLGACGGGNSSPSDPTPTMAIEALLVNADGLATLIRVDLHYDGVFQGSAGGSETSPQSPPMHTTVSAPAGAHVLRAIIVDQRASPSRYTFTATGTRNGQNRNLGSVTATVATGGAIDLAFTL